MTVREMVERLRVNTKVEIRINNYKVISAESEDIDMVKEGLLNKKVNDWGVINTDKIFINVEEDEHDGE